MGLLHLQLIGVLETSTVTRINETGVLESITETMINTISGSSEPRVVSFSTFNSNPVDSVSTGW